MCVHTRACGACVRARSVSSKKFSQGKIGILLIFHLPADPRTRTNESRRGGVLEKAKIAARDFEREDLEIRFGSRAVRTTKFLFSLTKLQLVRVRDSSRPRFPIDVPVLRGITETLGAKLPLNSHSSFQFVETPNNRRLETRVRKREKDWLEDGANRDEKETNLPYSLLHNL